MVQLKDDLIRYGLKVWLDKDKIRPGDLFVEALETALDYLLDDPELADKIYRELAASHTLLGNTSKAGSTMTRPYLTS